ncbi:Uma2 family endonuclease [Chamaesiphon sp. OTE_75_metabat_556]|uniref:Uma2 family endonuclease n=1 Tax=Chamaesiphon sp. OTE_75_metabat_556 TaxID=2964692 RepID=UPI002869FC9D|nr:Uma2 family endonuclease [Chamaesiphon sp. OTE_75_metabat_556]
MTNLQIKTAPMSMTVDISALMTLPQMSEAQFYEFCHRNPNLRIERNPNGEVIVMPPAFSDTGNRNNKIGYQLTRWTEERENGEAFDSSAGFTLPNGAVRSPDASWIRLDRWNALTEAQKASFAPICPDFVVELRSASDTLKSLQTKMQEYIENGARLGLLIDRQTRTVYCYRADGSVAVLNQPERVSCDPELPGLTLQMAKIW